MPARPFTDFLGRVEEDRNSCPHVLAFQDTLLEIVMRAPIRAMKDPGLTAFRVEFRVVVVFHSLFPDGLW